VVRGGGETRRNTAIAFALTFIVAAMMLGPQVSAGKSTEITVPDRIGDLGKYNLVLIVGPTKAPKVPDPTWGDNAPVMEATYVDMVSLSIAMVHGKYVFSMELAGDLPQAGDPMPPGIRYVGWQWWIEDGPWDPMSPIIPKTYYWVCLELDESGYSAGIYDARNAWAYTPVPFTIDGATFQIQVPEKLLGGLESFWWSACTYVAKEHYNAWPWFTDLIDPGTDHGQIGTDFPWPPV
jgi:hypothetical protein